MKKLLSISFSFLILISVMHITIATHYCGGHFAASKVSLSGELATCGMETEGACPVSGKQVESNCCHNNVSVLAVDHNYAPSFTQFTSFAQTLLQVFIVPATTTIHSFTAINVLSADNGPPGNILVNAVSLPKICVFLI